MGGFVVRDLLFLNVRGAVTVDSAASRKFATTLSSLRLRCQGLDGLA